MLFMLDGVATYAHLAKKKLIPLKQKTPFFRKDGVFSIGTFLNF